jgi:hypothetical protein
VIESENNNIRERERRGRRESRENRESRSSGRRNTHHQSNLDTIGGK